MTRPTYLALTLWVFGCSSGSTTPDTSNLTYYKDVKPLVEAKCLSCHAPGGVGPFTLTTYDEVVAHKQEIKIAVEKRVMPPWLAKQGCSDYVFDRSLSDAQIATVTGWVTAGTKEGKLSEYVAPTLPPDSGLSRVDRTVQLPLTYTPKVSPDEYRCFIVDWPESKDRFVTGFRVNPGNPKIVHHVIAFAAPPSELAAFQRLEDADPDPGYVCFGGPGGSGQGPQWVGSWAPGSGGTDFAPATGIKLAADSKIILQVHYNTSTTAPAPDLTSVDFKLDDTVAKQAVQQPWANPAWLQAGGMMIPAGASDVMHRWPIDPTPYMPLATDGVIPAGTPFTIYGVGLHMHTRGTSATFIIERKDGTRECMLDIPRWNFHWQGGYGFTTPKVFNPGDKLVMECHWDNSSGTRDLQWGEGTGDEMCLAGMYISP